MTCLPRTNQNAFGGEPTGARRRHTKFRGHSERAHFKIPLVGFLRWFVSHALIIARMESFLPSLVVGSPNHFCTPSNHSLATIIYTIDIIIVTFIRGEVPVER
jgi:hypothetical protein